MSTQRSVQFIEEAAGGVDVVYQETIGDVPISEGQKSQKQMYKEQYAANQRGTSQNLDLASDMSKEE